MTAGELTFLCLASFHKGDAFLKEAKALGCRVILLTAEKWAHDETWPFEAIDAFHVMPRLHAEPDITHAVSYLARTEDIARVIAIDDYDVETAGTLRDHLRLPGLGGTVSRHFRDKLAMRSVAQAAGIPVPAFTGVFNDARVGTFLDAVAGPWLLKPRAEASAMGIKRIDTADELWPTLEALGDQRSFFLLEQYVPGEVFHVDGLAVDGELVFQRASGYARPPLDVYQGGGVFVTTTLPTASATAATLAAMNQDVQHALGMVRGATHTEFIRGRGGGFVFLETAARVGGANIADAIAYASGVNLWREWARIEVADVRGRQYALPEIRDEAAGVITCLSRQQWPDLSAYSDPEVVWRLEKDFHAGLILAGPDHDRVASLLDRYAARFADEFLAVAPPMQSGRT